MGRHVIVDGYNVIRQDPDLRRTERRSLEQARETLLVRLNNAEPLRGDRVTVVFDGWDSANPRETRETRGGVEVVYSKHGERADEVIKRLAAEARRLGEVLVVTDDAEIREQAKRVGQEAVRVPRRVRNPQQQFDGRLAKEEDYRPASTPTKRGNPQQAKKTRRRSPRLW